MSRPRPMMTTRSAMSCISLMRWLDTSTVRPSSANPRSSERIHRTPSRSRPLTGSSNSRTPGSPSRAAAIPRRWRMPSEYVLMRRREAPSRPTCSMTSSTRARRESRCCERRSAGGRVRCGPGCMAPASSSAPTSRSGAVSPAYARPSTSAVPDVGRSRPMTTRMVVDFPAPLGPRKPVTVPALASKVRSSTARSEPCSLVSARTLITVVPSWVGRHVRWPAVRPRSSRATGGAVLGRYRRPRAGVVEDMWRLCAGPARVRPVGEGRSPRSRRRRRVDRRDGDERDPQVADPGEDAVQLGLVGDGTGEGRGAVAAWVSVRPPNEGCPVGVQVPADPQHVGGRRRGGPTTRVTEAPTAGDRAPGPAGSRNGG